MINKIAGAMAIIGVLMLVLMLVYVDQFQWLHRGVIGLGAIIFAAPWVCINVTQKIFELNADYFDEQ